MHELSITRNTIAIVGEEAGERQVLRLQLWVGKLTCVMPQALRFCLDTCSAGTVLEGARLEIEEIPGRLRCEDCQREFASDQLFGECECGSRELRCIAGEELLIREMEIA